MCNKYVIYHLDNYPTTTREGPRNLHRLQLHLLPPRRALQLQMQPLCAGGRLGGGGHQGALGHEVVHLVSVHLVVELAKPQNIIVDM